MLPFFRDTLYVLKIQRQIQKYKSVFPLCCSSIAIYHQPGCAFHNVSQFKSLKKSLFFFFFFRLAIFPIHTPAHLSKFKHFWLLSFSDKLSGCVVLLYKDNWDKAGHLSLSDILVLSIGGNSGGGLQQKCFQAGRR